MVPFVCSTALRLRSRARLLMGGYGHRPHKPDGPLGWSSEAESRARVARLPLHTVGFVRVSHGLQTRTLGEVVKGRVACQAPAWYACRTTPFAYSRLRARVARACSLGALQQLRSSRRLWCRARVVPLGDGVNSELRCTTLRDQSSRDPRASPPCSPRAMAPSPSAPRRSLPLA